MEMSLLLDDQRESQLLSSEKTKIKFEQNVFKLYDVQNAYCISLAHVLQTSRRKGDNALSEKTSSMSSTTKVKWVWQDSLG